MATSTLDTIEDRATQVVLDLSIAAYNENAAQYAEWAQTLPMSSQLEQFLATVPAAGRILDAGCGPGRDLGVMESLGYQTTGVDLSTEFVDLARASGHDVHLSDLRSLPFPDATFDGVWSCASLVHLPVTAAADALTELRRVTDDGGSLFVTVKAGGTGGAWEDTLHGRRWFYRWDVDTFAALTAEAGYLLRSVELTGSGPRSWVEIHATAS